MDGERSTGNTKVPLQRLAKIRAAYARAGIRVFGFRVVEPHHDGTPHWHMLLFVRPEQVDELRDIFCYYTRLEDSEELRNLIKR
ncbi:replication endonuclease [Providencia rettgeri]|uniref:Replication endonuclease n=1 Tax=Providencia rettgeri TaxID=587 RepID=A0A939NCJ3_PRORE|nr:replication endonuclease [Providencia rettgeri]